MAKIYNFYQGNGTNKKIYITKKKTILNFENMSYDELGIPSGRVGIEFLEENYVYGKSIRFYFGPYEDRINIMNFKKLSYAKRPSIIIRTSDGDKNIADIFEEVYLNFDDYSYFRILHYTGTFFNDYVVGNNLNNRIKGGAGDDKIYGGAGRDKLYGGIGDDYISGGLGNDYIYGGKGDDEIHAGDGNDYINAGSGDNIIYGDLGTCKIRVGNGNNIITGSINYNSIIVGNGCNEITTYDANDYIKVGNGSDNYINAGAGINTIKLGKGKNNVIYSSGGNDIIYYNKSGSIVLDVSDTTIDSIEKNKSNLIIEYNNGTYTKIMNFFKGKFKDIGLIGSNYYSIANLNDSIPICIFGKEKKKNTITGTKFSDEIYGGEKSDLLKGNNGNDTIYGEDGNDKLYGGKGDDTINAGAGNNYIYFKKGDGNDIIENSDGVDTLVFAKGTNLTYNYYKYDLIINYSADDSVSLKDYFKGHSVQYVKIGKKKMAFNPPRQKIVEHEENGYHVINATEIDDIVIATDNDDKIFGNNGNDNIYAKAGNDIVNTGGGNNILVFVQGDGNDIIENSSGTDAIEFTSSQNLNFIHEMKNNDLILSYGDNDSIILKDYYINNSHSVKNINNNGTIISLENAIAQYGLNCIYERQSAYNTIEIPSYSFDSISYIRNSDNLLITWGTNDSILLKDYFNNNFTDNNHSIRNIIANNQEDLLANKVTLYIDGTNNAETINGTFCTDIIDAKKGNDTIDGKSGTNTYLFVSDDGEDTIINGTGTDTVKFNNNYDLRCAHDLSNNDLILKYGNSDKINLKDYYINNSHSVKTIQNGNDTLTLEQVINQYGMDIIGITGADSIVGTIANDIITAGQGDDIIDGNAGDDVIYGGQGDDVIYGGFGADTIVFAMDDGNDILVSNTDGVEDTIKFTDIDIADVTYEENGTDLILKYGNNDSITLKKTYNGYTVSNYTYQKLEGRNEYDTLTLNEFKQGTKNIVIAKSGATTHGTSINDTITGTNGDDIIIANRGNDTIDAKQGNDTIYGGDDDDTIDGGYGSDTIDGGAGDDTINGGDGNDTIDGGYGDDTIDGGYGDDILIGNSGNNDLRGNYGNDTYIISLAPNSYDYILHDSDGDDTVIIQNSKENIALYYNVTKYGNAYSTLYIKDRSSLTEQQGLEHSLFNKDSYIIETTIINNCTEDTSDDYIWIYDAGQINTITSQVTSWLNTNNNYTSVEDVINSGNETDINSVLSIFDQVWQS